ncbi:efflux RND transporter periplasmic adaptor subunit [Robbsia andropogonis]|uniref:efflux RND transporter periplasmic adaptor subunit n=1 Tax=Robbsia andropogonis TaxID=28092 RepID=UPI0004666EA1|nr:efflux RND transporter periplasmic adaptor subunit [Robbsia andropogonis]MCP1118528.1 efflux RND transporter periplasmic adaptor subunit [Robbsia andropogonis]MCP1127995.1 efflux RND transporter periplasmic adaptor subunit [Robbsia andropogonis]
MNEKHHAELAISAPEPGESPVLPARGTAWRRAKFSAAVVLLLMALGTLRIAVADFEERHEVAAATVENAKQYVHVVNPKPANANGTIRLPGTLRGAVESPIYARASGYLMKRYVDIGSRVTQGQLLAELDTPEIDQQLIQALAQRAQTAASLGLAKSSFDRWQKLHDRDAVSQQELDERQSAYTQGIANLAAADANVQRLKQLESFKRIVAPFSGVVTQRNVDVGDLVDAGGGGSNSTRALFALAQTDTLRVYVQVPQAYAQGVRQGQVVSISQAELPGRAFEGTIAHIAGAIDVATRSLQIEIRMVNPENTLRPGAYVQVALPAAVRSQYVIPGNTMLFRAQGPQVAIARADGTVHLQSIVIAQDFGQSLEIESGIGPHDRLILNPSDSIAEGDPVHIVETAATMRSASSPAQATSAGARS